MTKASRRNMTRSVPARRCESLSGTGTGSPEGVTQSGMHGNLREVLKQWLGEDTRALDVLSESQLQDLHDALTAARKRQARALAAASDEALRQMPALVRVSVGKILRR